MMIDSTRRDGFGRGGGEARAGTTGRYVVVLAEPRDDPRGLLRDAGVAEVLDSRDFTEDITDVSGGPGAVYLADLGIVVVAAEDAQVSRLGAGATEHGPVLSVSPELVHHVMDTGSADYLRGYRDGVTDLGRRLESGTAREDTATEGGPPYFEDTDRFTWGLQATQVLSSPHSGAGVRVAVLDTGFDIAHPDFAQREVVTHSFVPGETAQDGHGHGTHCIGTACGPREPGTGPRYGVAHGAEIYAGKVLGDAGEGSDAGILAGIDWALGHGCAVISMSLGADVRTVHPPYTAAGRRALDRGALLVAAAGNNADRVNGDAGFVGAPANSPFVMAVGALNQQLDTAWFSARTLPGSGGQVDVAAPGFEVHSSWPMPVRRRTISGTSMAAPHVAGVAALLAEATGRRGRELWAELVQESRRLAAPSLDVGSGLVLARTR
ncbi:S8 family serine peptidase [Kocuria sp. M1R5S2]|uniref:S8 family serine peptidase n=1 Tax=Kocuria rhizosphaerae TaxID=3376285 RepID=UPI0037B30DC5